MPITIEKILAAQITPTTKQPKTLTFIQALLSLYQQNLKTGAKESAALEKILAETESDSLEAFLSKFIGDSFIKGFFVFFTKINTIFNSLDDITVWLRSDEPDKGNALLTHSLRELNNAYLYGEISWLPNPDALERGLRPPPGIHLANPNPEFIGMPRGAHNSLNETTLYDPGQIPIPTTALQRLSIANPLQQNPPGLPLSTLTSNIPVPGSNTTAQITSTTDEQKIPAVAIEEKNQTADEKFLEKIALEIVNLSPVAKPDPKDPNADQLKKVASILKLAKRLLENYTARKDKTQKSFLIEKWLTTSKDPIHAIYLFLDMIIEPLLGVGEPDFSNRLALKPMPTPAKTSFFKNLFSPSNKTSNPWQEKFHEKIKKYQLNAFWVRNALKNYMEKNYRAGRESVFENYCYKSLERLDLDIANYGKVKTRIILMEKKITTKDHFAIYPPIHCDRDGIPIKFSDKTQLCILGFTEQNEPVLRISKEMRNKKDQAGELLLNVEDDLDTRQANMLDLWTATNYDRIFLLPKELLQGRIVWQADIPSIRYAPVFDGLTQNGAANIVYYLKHIALFIKYNHPSMDSTQRQTISKELRAFDPDVANNSNHHDRPHEKSRKNIIASLKQAKHKRRHHPDHSQPPHVSTPISPSNGVPITHQNHRNTL